MNVSPEHLAQSDPQAVLDTFEINRERAIDYLNTRENVYVFDGYAGVCFNGLLGLFFHICTVGPGIPHQGSRHLCPRISRSFHGTSLDQLVFCLYICLAQYAHSTDRRAASRVWRS